MRLRKICFYHLLFFNICNICYAQEISDGAQDSNSHDSLIVKRNIVGKIIDYLGKTNEVNEDKRFDFSIIGGPHYSSSIKFGLGIVGSGLFRVDPSDKSISPSNVSVVADFSTSGFYMLGIRGNILFPEEDYRIDFNTGFSSFPSRFWGIGYDAGRQDHYSKYTLEEIYLRADFLKKLVPKAYMGFITTIRNNSAKKFKEAYMLQDKSKYATALGGGVILSYDSRDFIPNPAKGLYAKIEQQFYPHFLGSTETFYKTEFVARYYKQAWKGSILAFDLQGTFNNGDVPWSMNAMMGGSYQMRGYFEGRYNDKNLIQTQMEVRQHIYRRSGAVAWVGAGNVFPKFSKFEWKNTLPTYGIGYRWEFKKRVNVRLDYGFGKNESAFYFNINEAF